jgi:hypothetical protein
MRVVDMSARSEALPHSVAPRRRPRSGESAQHGAGGTRYQAQSRGDLAAESGVDVYRVSKVAGCSGPTNIPQDRVCP